MADEAILSKFTVMHAFRDAGPVRSYRAQAADGSDLCVKFVDVDADFAHAALRAMEALRPVQSPNVARIVETGLTDTGYYFAREWVQGTHLGTRPLPSTLPPKTAAAAVAQGLAGLSAVHAAGLIGGDIKPSSFVVAPDGVTKLVDAVLPPIRVADGGPSEAAYYTSPEELQGQNPSQRTDQYRVGLVLYEVLTGEHPFSGIDALAVVEGHRSGTPASPSSMNSASPKGLDPVVLRAMSKDPAMRYESADAMKQAIEAETTGRKLPWLWIGIAAAAVVVLLILAAGSATTGTPPWVWLLGGSAQPTTVAVPGIVGMKQAAAEASITAAGLQVGKVALEATVGAAPGIVLAQSPAPGTSVNPSSSVDYTVALLPTVKVPNVSGVPESEATGLLADEGLRVGTLTYVNDSKVKAGYVISQLPASGAQVPIGSAVELTVSKGEKTGLVPNVVGLTEDDAKATLSAADFKVTSTKATDANVPAGEVIKQSPAAGATAAVGSSVAITVSSGKPQEPKVAVPDVTGMSPRDARAALQDLKLTVGYAFVAAPTPDDVMKVVQQDPAANAQVSAGAKVTITIGLPSFSFDAQPAPLPAPTSQPTPTPTTTPPPSGAVPTAPIGSAVTTP